MLKHVYAEWLFVEHLAGDGDDSIYDNYADCFLVTFQWFVMVLHVGSGVKGNCQDSSLHPWCGSHQPPSPPWHLLHWGSCTGKVQSVVTQVQLQCCFTSTETIKTIRDGEPRTVTSTFTQLLSHDSWWWSVALRPQKLGLFGTGAQDVHLDFHTAPELCMGRGLVEVLLYVHRNCRFIRDGSPGCPPRLSHSSCALASREFNVALRPQRP